MSHQEKASHHEVRVYIDDTPHSSPNPTTGAALYTLGSVPPERELLREVEGNREDKLVSNDEHVVHLHEDEHLYSALPEFSIIVNARAKVVNSAIHTFEQIVALADNLPAPGPYILYTVMYERGPRQNPEGTMPEGSTVWLKDRMIFHVTATDKS